MPCAATYTHLQNSFRCRNSYFFPEVVVAAVVEAEALALPSAFPAAVVEAGALAFSSAFPEAVVAAGAAPDFEADDLLSEDVRTDESDDLLSSSVGSGYGTSTSVSAWRR